jgi:hypothetical protein
MDGLAKPERSEGFGADRVLGHEGYTTDVGDAENSHGRLTSDASHRERSELGEINTLVERATLHPSACAPTAAKREKPQVFSRV